MSLILIDEAMRAKLADAGGPVELVAQDGTLLGRFTPMTNRMRRQPIPLVVVDEVMRAKLATADGTVELMAQDGTLLGKFTPTTQKVQYDLDPGISEEELARQRADKTSPTYTTEEVLAKLRSL